MKKQAENWLNFAEIDLLTADKLLSDELLTQSTAFHLQQRVEKIFKAILENNNIPIPKTHNLERLYAMIEEIDSFSIELDEDVHKTNNNSLRRTIFVYQREQGEYNYCKSGKKHCWKHKAE